MAGTWALEADFTHVAGVGLDLAAKNGQTGLHSAVRPDAGGAETQLLRLHRGDLRVGEHLAQQQVAVLVIVVDLLRVEG
ncbi:MAG: hypothetical protein H7A44_04055 [Opitutaceae bacterium]|nr:hypothetical protein [Opitutaceae bacterium]